jgi:hypothetical protein
MRFCEVGSLYARNQHVGWGRSVCTRARRACGDALASVTLPTRGTRWLDDQAGERCIRPAMAQGSQTTIPTLLIGQELGTRLRLPIKWLISLDVHTVVSPVSR